MTPLIRLATRVTTWWRLEDKSDLGDTIAGALALILWVALWAKYVPAWLAH